jgi:exodeoxyribonuclease V gamma subunit
LEDERSALHDEELFGLGGLDLYQLLDHELQHVPTELNADTLPAHVQQVVQRLRQAGALPLAGVGTLEAQKLSARLQAMLGAALSERQAYPHAADRVLVDLPHAQVALQDALSDVLTGEGGHLSLHLRANDLASFKTQKPLAYADKLIDIWLLSLAAAAMDQPFQCVVVGRNAVLRVPEPGPEQGPEAARAQLAVLLSTWAEGMCWPLPLPPGVALQWLQIKDKDKDYRNALADTYEGSEFKRSEKDKDPALARTYPTVEDLLATRQFERLAQTVYEPLKVWAEALVIAPLPDAPEDESDEMGEQA